MLVRLTAPALSRLVSSLRLHAAHGIFIWGALGCGVFGGEDAELFSEIVDLNEEAPAVTEPEPIPAPNRDEPSPHDHSATVSPEPVQPEPSHDQPESDDHAEADPPALPDAGFALDAGNDSRPRPPRTPRR